MQIFTFTLKCKACGYQFNHTQKGPTRHTAKASLETLIATHQVTCHNGRTSTSSFKFMGFTFPTTVTTICGNDIHITD